MSYDNYKFHSNFDKIEELHNRKLKRTTKHIFAHAQIFHAVLYGHKKMKFLNVEVTIVTLLILNFSHFNVNIFVQKNNIYQNI